MTVPASCRGFAWVAASLLLAGAFPIFAQDEDPYVRTVDGLTVYFGAVRADALGAPTPAQPAMHHSARHGLPDEHHIMVALFDAVTGERVTRAQVTAWLAGAAQARSVRVLEPMAIAGAMTFGSFMPLSGSGPHVIRLEIQRPGHPRPARTSFTYPLPGN